MNNVEDGYAAANSCLTPKRPTVTGGGPDFEECERQVSKARADGNMRQVWSQGATKDRSDV
jgi:hypothetical protein